MQDKFFTELSKFKTIKKVELTVMNDIITRHKAISKDTSQFLSLQNEFFAALRKAENLSGLLTDSVKAQRKDLENATKKYKELGLDPKDLFKFEKLLNEAEFEVKDFKKKVK